MIEILKFQGSLSGSFLRIEIAHSTTLLQVFFGIKLDKMNEKNILHNIKYMKKFLMILNACIKAE